MTFTIKASWIKEICEGRNDNWGYDYKEYVFNDSFIESAWIRIPLNAPDIRAMEYNRDGGIKAEYNQIYLDTEGTITTIFDIRYTAADRADQLTEQVETLTQERDHLNEANEIFANRNIKVAYDNDTLAAKLAAAEQEITTLKAKLYDLMTAVA